VRSNIHKYENVKGISLNIINKVKTEISVNVNPNPINNPYFNI